MSDPAVSSPTASPKGKKGRVHLPKLHSPFHKRKANKKKDAEAGDEHDDQPITTEEEPEVKEIESCLSEGGTNINIVVSASKSSDGENQPKEEAPVDNLAHPSLRPLYIRDVDSGQVLPANSEPIRISNEWFDMDMVLMLRTPNVDNPDGSEPGSEWNQQVADYFRTKQRRFEYQFQVKLKKTPESKDLYYAIQWEKPVKMGILQKALVNACLAFLKRTRPTFHYSVSGCSERGDDGAFEKPHLANFVERGLDRVVITPIGETPPKLGGDLHEDLDHYKKRKAGKIKVDFNTENVYTLALWNANVDWIDWKIVGVPGIKSFDLKTILGSQSLNIFLYMLDKNRGNDHHYQKDIETIINLEFSSDHQQDDKDKGKHRSSYLSFW